MNRIGNHEVWERFRKRLSRRQSERVDNDVQITWAISEEDYVTAMERASVVAFGDTSECRAERKAREFEDWLFELIDSGESAEANKYDLNEQAGDLLETKLESSQPGIVISTYWECVNKRSRSTMKG